MSTWMTARRRRAMTFVAIMAVLLAIAVAFAPLPSRARGSLMAGGSGAPDHAVPGSATARAAAARVAADPEGCTQGYVALTFDDGPSPTYTDPLLDFLESARVPATFFVQGVRAQAYPAQVQRAAKAGFAIGNHSWDHPHLPKLSDQRVASELSRTADTLKSLDINPGARMRSPYGEDGPRVVAIANSMGMTPIRWTDDSEDYAHGTPNEIADRVISRLIPHTMNVVLEHDGIDAPKPQTGRIVAEESLQAVPLIVSAARSAGYCFTEFAPDASPMVPAPTWTGAAWAVRAKPQS